jgi:hypothetical protein
MMRPIQHILRSERGRYSVAEHGPNCFVLCGPNGFASVFCTREATEKAIDQSIESVRRCEMAEMG